ncbi:phage tail protein [Actinokineospora pegani]|uniref:phage tail protein n=1 Tax=Actinokineospora pegani TaxID=2654637 RepID=UPI0012E9DA07|nr:phage tail protein [Actinokineospora pegani]
MTMPRVSMASSNTSSLVSAARFVVQFDGGSEITFSEMSGIVSEVEVTEYLASGKVGVSMSKQFGKTKPATVVLKRGVDQDYALWTWHQEVLAGQPTARRTCSLILLDMANVPKQTYQLLNAWPSKLEIGGLKAGGSEAVIATVTLTCEQIDLTKG